MSDLLVRTTHTRTHAHRRDCDTSAPPLAGAEDALTSHDKKGILFAPNPPANDESTGGASTLRPLPENAPYCYLALFFFC